MGEYSFRSDPRIYDWQRDKLREYCSSLEMDIAELAVSFGLKVFKDNLLPYERGYLERIPSLKSTSGWVIKINQRDRPEVQNFTVAHELGHFTLHKASLEKLDVFDGRMNRSMQSADDPFSYLGPRDKIMEAEANSFATLLLMPPNLFKPAYVRLGRNINALANLFCVSEGTIARRIKELGLK